MWQIPLLVSSDKRISLLVSSLETVCGKSLCLYLVLRQYVAKAKFDMYGSSNRLISTFL